MNKLILIPTILFLFVTTVFVIENITREQKRISHNMEQISEVLGFEVKKEDSLLGIIVRLHTENKEHQDKYRNKIWVD